MQRISDAYILDNFSDAISQEYIKPYFQPIFRSVTGQVCCLEALARWCDPVYGILTPDMFIPVLEKHGLIFELDMEILRAACSFYSEMKQRGTPFYSFSVNISRHDFQKRDLFDRVTASLDTYDVPFDAIRLEITESIMLEDIGAFQRIFKQFHDVGILVWIDDFGSAYSSLNVLQNYEFDTMKFDMLFLKNLTARGKQVLASQINMAKSLNMHTLVEGVETEEQRKFLLSVGCEALQGFYYSKPLSSEDFIALADKNGNLIESLEDKNYWNQIGRFNFLSPSPLTDFDAACGNGTDQSDSLEKNIPPLALIEFIQDQAYYVYANEGYLKSITSLGYDSIEAVEQSFNEKKSDQYLMTNNIIADAIATDKIQELDYRNEDIYYKLSARCLARNKKRAMLAFQIQTFDSDREMETSSKALQYGNALFSTYEIVTLVYPRTGTSRRIYAADFIPEYDNVKAETLKESIHNFCRAEIVPEDQQRYMRFFDLDTLDKRIGNNPRGFVQNAFRLSRNTGPGNKWRNIRISRVPSEEAAVYIYTIQVVQSAEEKMLDVLAEEHPELLG